tara:strand:- start:340 stop:543 length:204 start_codon:yes stop_codon:yes gene_type:complete
MFCSNLALINIMMTKMMTKMVTILSRSKLMAMVEISSLAKTNCKKYFKTTKVVESTTLVSRAQAKLN